MLEFKATSAQHIPQHPFNLPLARRTCWADCQLPVRDRLDGECIESKFIKKCQGYPVVKSAQFIESTTCQPCAVFTVLSLNSFWICETGTWEKCLRALTSYQPQHGLEGWIEKDRAVIFCVSVQDRRVNHSISFSKFMCWDTTTVCL